MDYLKILLLKGGLLAKSRKLFFQRTSFLEGKIQKMQKKISKNFIVPNRLLDHTDHLYIYKGHIEKVVSCKNAKKFLDFANNPP